MKKLLLIAPFIGEVGRDNNRFVYLAKYLSQYDYEVELITSSFSHTQKEQRNYTEESNLSFKLTYIYEKGYTKNVSITRISSHKEMAINLKEELNTKVKPDLIYCAVPTLEVGLVASNFSALHNIPFIIDIQDLWPEAFQMVIGKNTVTNFLLSTLKQKADKIYKSADGIIAVSDTYIRRAEQVNKDAYLDTVYIGTDLDTFDNLRGKPIHKPKDELWIGYVGTLGKSYNISYIIKAIEKIEKSKKTSKKLKFIVIGDGPEQQRFENEAEKAGIDAIFMGRKEYSEMVNFLVNFDIAVNPIKDNSAASIINKHADYAAAGLPVINTQQSTEYQNLIENYQMGYNCNNTDLDQLINRFILLIENEDLRKKMGLNSRKCAEEKFNRISTYPKIHNMIKNILSRTNRL